MAGEHDIRVRDDILASIRTCAVQSLSQAVRSGRLSTVRVGTVTLSPSDILVALDARDPEAVPDDPQQLCLAGMALDLLVSVVAHIQREYTCGCRASAKAPSKRRLAVLSACATALTDRRARLLRRAVRNGVSLDAFHAAKQTLLDRWGYSIVAHAVASLRPATAARSPAPHDAPPVAAAVVVESKEVDSPPSSHRIQVAPAASPAPPAREVPMPTWTTPAKRPDAAVGSSDGVYASMLAATWAVLPEASRSDAVTSSIVHAAVVACANVHAASLRETGARARDEYVALLAETQVETADSLARLRSSHSDAMSRMRAEADDTAMRVRAAVEAECARRIAGLQGEWDAAAKLHADTVATSVALMRECDRLRAEREALNEQLNAAEAAVCECMRARADEVHAVASGRARIEAAVRDSDASIALSSSRVGMLVSPLKSSGVRVASTDEHTQTRDVGARHESTQTPATRSTEAAVQSEGADQPSAASASVFEQAVQADAAVTIDACVGTELAADVVPVYVATVSLAHSAAPAAAAVAPRKIDAAVSVNDDLHAECRSRNHAVTSLLSDMRRSLKAADSALETARAQVESAVQDANGHKGTIVRLRSELKDVHDRKEATDGRLEVLTHEHAGVVRCVSDLCQRVVPTHEHGSVDACVAALGVALTALNAELQGELAARGSAEAAAAQAAIDLQREADRASAERAAAERDAFQRLETAAAAVAQLETQLADARTAAEARRADATSARDEATQLQSQLSSSREQVAMLEGELTDMHQRESVAHGRVQDLEAEAHALRMRCTTMEADHTQEMLAATQRMTSLGQQLASAQTREQASRTAGDDAAANLTVLHRQLQDAQQAAAAADVRANDAAAASQALRGTIAHLRAACDTADAAHASSIAAIQAQLQQAAEAARTADERANAADAAVQAMTNDLTVVRQQLQAAAAGKVEAEAVIVTLRSVLQQRDDASVAFAAQQQRTAAEAEARFTAEINAARQSAADAHAQRDEALHTKSTLRATLSQVEEAQRTADAQRDAARVEATDAAARAASAEADLSAAMLANNAATGRATAAEADAHALRSTCAELKQSLDAAAAAHVRDLTQLQAQLLDAQRAELAARTTVTERDVTISDVMQAQLTALRAEVQTAQLAAASAEQRADDAEAAAAMLLSSLEKAQASLAAQQAELQAEAERYHHEIEVARADAAAADARATGAEADAMLVHADLETVTAQHAAAVQSVASLEQQVLTMSTALLRREEALHDAQAAATELRLQLQQSETSLVATQTSVITTEQALAERSTQLAAAVEQCTAVTGQLTQAQIGLAAAQAAVAAHATAAAASSGERDDALESMRRAHAAVIAATAAAHAEEIHALQQDLQQLRTTTTDAAAARAAVSAELQQSRDGRAGDAAAWLATETALTLRLNAADATAAALRVEVVQLQRDLEAATADLAAAQQQQGQAAATEATLTQRVDTLTAEVEQLTTRALQAEQRVHAAHQAAVDVRAESDATIASLHAAAADAASRLAAADATIAGLQSAVASLQERTSVLEQQLLHAESDAQAALAQAAADAKALRTELGRRTADAAESAAANAAVAADLTAAVQRLQSAEADAAEWRQRATAAETAAHALRTSLADAQLSMASTEATHIDAMVQVEDQLREAIARAEAAESAAASARARVSALEVQVESTKRVGRDALTQFKLETATRSREARARRVAVSKALFFTQMSSPSSDASAAIHVSMLQATRGLKSGITSLRSEVQAHSASAVSSIAATRDAIGAHVVTHVHTAEVLSRIACLTTFVQVLARAGPVALLPSSANVMPEHVLTLDGFHTVLAHMLTPVVTYEQEARDALERCAELQSALDARDADIAEQSQLHAAALTSLQQQVQGLTAQVSEGVDALAGAQQQLGDLSVAHASMTRRLDDTELALAHSNDTCAALHAQADDAARGRDAALAQVGLLERSMAAVRAAIPAPGSDDLAAAVQGMVQELLQERGRVQAAEAQAALITKQLAAHVAAGEHRAAEDAARYRHQLDACVDACTGRVDAAADELEGTLAVAQSRVHDTFTHPSTHVCEAFDAAVEAFMQQLDAEAAGSHAEDGVSTALARLRALTGEIVTTLRDAHVCDVDAIRAEVEARARDAAASLEAVRSAAAARMAEVEQAATARTEALAARLRAALAAVAALEARDSIETAVTRGQTHTRGSDAHSSTSGTSSTVRGYPSEAPSTPVQSNDPFSPATRVAGRWLSRVHTGTPAPPAAGASKTPPQQVEASTPVAHASPRWSGEAGAPAYPAFSRSSSISSGGDDHTHIMATLVLDIKRLLDQEVHARALDAGGPLVSAAATAASDQHAIVRLSSDATVYLPNGELALDVTRLDASLTNTHSLTMALMDMRASAAALVSHLRDARNSVAKRLREKDAIIAQLQRERLTYEMMLSSMRKTTAHAATNSSLNASVSMLGDWSSPSRAANAASTAAPPAAAARPPAT